MSFGQFNSEFAMNNKNSNKSRVPLFKIHYISGSAYVVPSVPIEFVARKHQGDPSCQRKTVENQQVVYLGIVTV